MDTLQIQHNIESQLGRYLSNQEADDLQEYLEDDEPTIDTTYLIELFGFTRLHSYTGVIRELENARLNAMATCRTHEAKLIRDCIDQIYCDHGNDTIGRDEDGNLI
tara:strand:- start:404 stop:721 length:318 start_codon:yes stop_codon:yes gene_type:complete